MFGIVRVANEFTAFVVSAAEAKQRSAIAFLQVFLKVITSMPHGTINNKVVRDVVDIL